jgi:hypothetical protein
VAPPVPVRIVAPPKDQAVAMGAAASFEVGLTGTAPFAYQWHFNGAELAGETNAVLRLLHVDQDQAGTYRVRVRNPAGRVTSQDAQLCVLHDDEVHIVSVNMLPDRTISRVLLCGPSGTKGWLQGSSDFQNWTSLTNFTFTSNLYEYFDTEAAKHLRRYYKVAPPDSR